MIERLIRAEEWLARLEGVLILCAFSGLIVIMALQVIYRFVLAEPLDFTEEASRICMIWLVFIGAARALYEAEHFIVDFLVNTFPGPLRAMVGYLVDAITIVFMAVLVWIGTRNAIFGSGQIMPALGVSVATQTIAMPIGFLMMVLHALMFVLRRRHVGVPAEPEPDGSYPVREPVGAS